MKDRITIEGPSGKGMTVKESSYFMSSWWRVVAWDGSTIAYVPDESTAKYMGLILNTKLGRKIR